MGWVKSIFLIFIITSGAFSKAVTSTANATFIAQSRNKNRFIEKFSQQSGAENLEALQNTLNQSQFEFSRNLSWLEEWAINPNKSPEMELAFSEFLEALESELQYFPDNLIFSSRVIDGLGPSALPIAESISLQMQLNWYQLGLNNIPSSTVLESTLILLHWHQTVESDFNARWRDLTEEVQMTEICQQSTSCVERVQQLLYRGK